LFKKKRFNQYAFWRFAVSAGLEGAIGKFIEE